MDESRDERDSSPRVETINLKLQTLNPTNLVNPTIPIDPMNPMKPTRPRSLQTPYPKVEEEEKQN